MPPTLITTDGIIAAAAAASQVAAVAADGAVDIIEQMLADAFNDLDDNQAAEARAAVAALKGAADRARGLNVQLGFSPNWPENPLENPLTPP